MFTYAWLKDVLERAGKSFVQALIAAWVLSPAFDYSNGKSLLLAAVVAGLTVVKGALSALVPAISPASVGISRHWLPDAAERLLATFLEAFLAAWLLNPGFDLSAARSAALAGVAAALSVLTSLLSAPVPSTLTPASLVSGPDRAHRRT